MCQTVQRYILSAPDTRRMHQHITYTNLYFECRPMVLVPYSTMVHTKLLMIERTHRETHPGCAGLLYLASVPLAISIIHSKHFVSLIGHCVWGPIGQPVLVTQIMQPASTTNNDLTNGQRQCNCFVLSDISPVVGSPTWSDVPVGTAWGRPPPWRCPQAPPRSILVYSAGTTLSPTSLSLSVRHTRIEKALMKLSDLCHCSGQVIYKALSLQTRHTFPH